MSPSRPSPLALCFVLPAAAGFLLAWFTGSGGSAPGGGGASPPVSSAAASAASKSGAPGAADSPEAGFIFPAPNPGEPVQRLLALLRARDLSAAAEFTLGHLQRKELLQALFEEEPETAMKFLEEFPDRGKAQDLAREMFHSMPPKDLPVLTAWMQRQEDSVFRHSLMRTLLPRWLREDEASAMAFVEKTRNQWDLGIAREAVKNHRMGDYQPVEARVEFIREQPVEKQAALWASGDFIRSMPERALPALAQLPESPERIDAVLEMAGQWGALDPLRAAKAAGELTDPALRVKAFEGIAKGWSGRDSYRASQWADALPKGPERDGAAAGLAGELSAHQPDAAFSWAEGIAEPEARLKALDLVFRNWRGSDSAAASAALSALPPQERERLEALPTFFDPPPPAQ